ncbi:hypothetical protein PVK06_017076 [Gossypium arboreum]|uniref:DUF4283 domain-containing protein n=1 Tax=Gossypium arboreum TaxID=29729 RepID=A0ABR0Q2H7_GOSAR|nr:hypothetical protein PVK06_017076 [Gossypium arboreum]
MERGIAYLSIEDREEEAFSVPDGVEPQNSVYNFCLVGWYLTASVVHFPAMRNMMANLWHPLDGMQISNLGEKCFLFKFFNELDISRVITGHGDNFCLVILHHDMHETEMGWDLTLCAQLGSAHAVRRLQHILNIYNLQIVFFIEKIRRRCGIFNGVDVPADATYRELSFGWNGR